MPRPIKEASGDAASVSSGNSTAGRVIDILLLFDDRRPKWSVAELMQHLNIPRSTLYRYLTPLRHARLLAETGDGEFQLGPRIQLLANVARSSVSLIDIARSEMLKIAESFNETVLFNERIDYDIVTLERIESRHRLRLASTRGSLLPWPATPSSKLLLAYAPPDEQKKFWEVSHPIAYTEYTITTRESMERELALIRRRGYSYSDEERDEGVIGLAVPIPSYPIGVRCLSIVAPKFRVSPDVAERMREALLMSAQVIANQTSRS